MLLSKSALKVSPSDPFTPITPFHTHQIILKDRVLRTAYHGKQSSVPANQGPIIQEEKEEEEEDYYALFHLLPLRPACVRVGSFHLNSAVFF